MDWVSLDAWWEKVERHRLHGLHFQHIVLCARRAWLHHHHIMFLNEHMRRASVAHELAYSRDVSVRGLLGLAPDRIIWSEQVVEEHKHNQADHDCARAQALFYAAALTQATRKIWKGRLLSLSSRYRETLELTQENLDWIYALTHSVELLETSQPPEAVRTGICKSCSFSALCWGA